MKTLAVIAALALVGCTDTDRAWRESYGKPHIVCLFASDGVVVGKWRSTGKVDSQGSLHIFNDASNTYVKVSGTVVVSYTDYCKAAPL